MSHEVHRRASADIRVGVAILTLSDTRTPDTDASGRSIRRHLESAGHTVVDHALIPDDPTTLRATLDRWLADDRITAILTTGGTGIGRRDTTIPVIESLITLPLPGFGELFRMLSHAQVGSAAMLSRAAAGITTGRKLLAALPGSTAAVDLAMQALIVPQLGHIVHELQR